MTAIFKTSRNSFIWCAFLVGILEKVLKKSLFPWYSEVMDCESECYSLLVVPCCV